MCVKRPPNTEIDIFSQVDTSANSGKIVSYFPLVPDVWELWIICLISVQF